METNTTTLTPGLVSVTFRKLASGEIIELVSQAGLGCIEWGGDIHCPPGDETKAREVARQTTGAGLSVAAYGSYYRLAKDPREQPPFEEVLATAAALGAPSIRVWAGVKGSAETSAEERDRVAGDARRISSMAARAGISISLEYHANTLTDTTASASAFLDEVDDANVRSLWQPRAGDSLEQNLEALGSVLPRLAHVHAFHWIYREGARERRFLEEGRADWTEYLGLIRSTGRSHAVMLEFVRGDDPDAFRRDAAALLSWLE